MLKMISSAVLGAFFLTVALMKGIPALRELDFLTCGLPFLVLSTFGSLWLVRKRCYRPQENHLGVIYRLERFHRFVQPDEWTFLVPLLDALHHEIGLYPRTAELSLEDVELRDGLLVTLRMKVFFKTDPRGLSRENLILALKFQGDEWTSIVKTNTEDIVRNQVFLNLTYPELADLRKSRQIKRMLGVEAAERMKNMGILVGEYGVMPLAVLPNSLVRNAVQAQHAAVPMGGAALERLRPVLDTMKQMQPEYAHAALLLEIASKIVETGQLPEIVLSPSGELPLDPSHSLGKGSGSGSGSGGNGGGKRPLIGRASPLDLPLAK